MSRLHPRSTRPDTPFPFTRLFRSDPSHGTSSVGGDVVTYTPAAGYYGADSFTYMATGPGGTSAPATVSLTVGTPPAPTAGDKSGVAVAYGTRSEEHTSELQSLMRISYAVFCLKKKRHTKPHNSYHTTLIYPMA